MTAHLAIDQICVTDLTDDDTHDFNGMTCMALIDGERCFASRVTSGSTTCNYIVDDIRSPYLCGAGDDVYAISSVFDIDGCLVFITTYGVTVCNGDRVLELIDIVPKTEMFEGYEKVSGRWSQKIACYQILVIDQKYILKRITWTDVRNNIHTNDEVGRKVEDFNHTGDGLATLTRDGKLALPSGKIANLKETSNTIKWSIVIKTSKLWIVGGDSGHSAMLATVNHRGKVLFTVKFKLSHASTTQYLKSVYDRTDRSMVMAVVKYFAIHLISVSSRGRLRRQVKPSFVAKCDKLDNLGESVIAVISLDKEGELFVVGSYWLKQIKLRIS